MKWTTRLNHANDCFGHSVERMKPETIERRHRERLVAVAARHADLIRQLTALVERDGPDSIWAEMLADAGKE